MWLRQFPRVAPQAIPKGGFPGNAGSSPEAHRKLTCLKIIYNNINILIIIIYNSENE
jgi:hypothetical protein